MKCFIRVSILIGFMLAFVGCSSEETKTVEWFMESENKQALHDTIAQCRNNPGKLAQTSNCVNAQEAADRIVLGGKMSRGEVLPPVTF